MMRTTSNHNLLAIAAALTLAACSNPFGGEREHISADGLTVTAAGDTLAVVLLQNVTGELTVNAGESRGPLTVTFTDRNGHPQSPGSDFWLRATVADESRATFDQPQAGAYTGTLTGLQPGTTSIIFELMHGAVGRGHHDYRAPAITIRVVE